ncbi:MAG: adenylate/guanylate cyclase domain-containing protein [Flavobacteriales bacterium]
MLPDRSSSSRAAGFGLVFDDPALEAEFWKSQDATTVQQVRIASVLGMAIILFFGFLVHEVITFGHMGDYVLRYGLSIPAILVAVLLTYYKRARRYRHASLGIAMLMSCVVVNHDIVYTDLPTDWVHSANMLVVGFTFTFLALPFRIALLLALVQTVLYETALVHRVGLDWFYITYSNAFFLSVQFVSGTAGFMLEQSYRRNFLQARNLDEQRALAEQNRVLSDNLLLNILPEEVAEELKTKGHADAKYFDSVTILFTDFKGFTQASEKLSPRELVEELNTCFMAFDAIITARGIEKIKTIDDAYMCAGGLPEPKTSSPVAVVHAALEMQAFMTRRKAERDAQGKPAFEMRVGIHTGPVVAGIVGVKKFQYDIWGDTVNTASRMESSGEVGQVNISEATYALVKLQSPASAGDATAVNGEWSIANGGSTHSPTPIHHSPSPPQGTSHSPFTNDHSPAFVFTPRGKVQAKGKGEMEMYFVGSLPQ